MKVSTYIINFIKKQWINCVFSVSWWMITHLEDAVFLDNEIKLISLKHEQAWAFAAEWYARSTGKTWIAMWTSWPWATNMVTWIANSFFDSIPVIYITGQVNTNEITTNKNIRQTWFQETDIISITKNITKFSYQIKNEQEIKYILEKSFFLANNSRKWPIVLDIPMNIQKQNIDENNLISFFDSQEYKNLMDVKNTNINYEDILNLLEKSSKPILLLWGWSKCLKNMLYFDSFLNETKIPVVTSLMWLDCIDHNYKNYIWMIWSYWNRESNIALMNSDLVLVLWSRLDIRQTGSDKDSFLKNKTIIHVELDKNELWYNIKNTQIKINSEINIFIENLINKIEKEKIKLNYSKWLKKLIDIKKIIWKNENKRDSWFYNPSYILKYLSDLTKNDKIITNDVWQNQMISSTSFSLNKKDKMLNSWWLWSMWFSLPASIWASIWNKNSFIISINGDGWFQMNMQELETIKYHNLPILIIILNNYSLWMVREFQDSYFEWRNIWTVIGYSCPNLKLIAKAYWIDYFKIWNWTFKWILKKVSQIKKPTILEIDVNPKSSITKVMFWNTIDNQSPELNNNLKEKIKLILNK